MQDFATGFPRGLQPKLDADADADAEAEAEAEAEAMFFDSVRIGLWLHERRPVVEVQRPRVGPRATSLLTSGRAACLPAGTLNAFNACPDREALAVERGRDGEMAR
ncbi:MAG: hypothetical protein JO006_04340 [Paucibacter sp.]|nr:hypothetical protein [Roseateles sp.]